MHHDEQAAHTKLVNFFTDACGTKYMMQSESMMPLKYGAHKLIGVTSVY